LAAPWIDPTGFSSVLQESGLALTHRPEKFRTARNAKRRLAVAEQETDDDQEDDDADDDQTADVGDAGDAASGPALGWGWSLDWDPARAVPIELAVGREVGRGGRATHARRLLQRR